MRRLPRGGAGFAAVAILVFLISPPRALGQTEAGWKLLWHDEFNGPVGSPPDRKKWTYDIGNGGANPGWGNHELESYTNSTDNVFLDGRGHLVIRAIRRGDGSFTSGRINTHGKFAFAYGRVEARIKIPYAQGIWPTFWLLGNDYPRTPWPRAGEIDVMENFGSRTDDASINRATLHGPGYAGKGITSEYRLPDGEHFSADFHLFGMEWSQGDIVFFVDKNLFARFTPNDLGGRPWVFDKPFFLILNIAVGGSPAPVGYPGPETLFPQDMSVSYVRVYQRDVDVQK